MVTCMMLVMAASPFVATDGGFSSISRTDVAHRTLEAFAPSTGRGEVVVSDGDAPGTQVQIILPAPASDLVNDAGVLRFTGGLGLRLTRTGPLALRIEADGDLGVILPPLAGHAGRHAFIQTARARYRLTGSSALLLNPGGVVRVTGPATWLDVELMPISEFRAWPTVAAGYWGAVLVWDEARSRLMRFGGAARDGFLQGTFVWVDGQGWVDLQVSSPAPRVRAAMTYDRLRQRVVLFGGLDENGVYLDDTWEFDGTQWTSHAITNHPSSRWSHGMAFDPIAQHTVLFAGLAGEVAPELGDTWTWDGTTWRQLFPLFSPSPRDAFGMTWDGTRQRITIAGGWDGLNNLNDSWTWNGSSWSYLGTLAGPARTSTALAWNPISGELVLTGGQDPRGGPRFYADVDLFDGASWRVGPSLPRGLMRPAVASHPAWGVALAGGTDRSPLGEVYRMEPVWQSLEEVLVRDARLTLDPARVLGETTEWIGQGTSWRASRTLDAGALQVVGSPVMGPLLITRASDGGWSATRFGDSVEVAPPPPGARLGGHGAHAWAVDLSGTLLFFDGASWIPRGQVPAGLEVLESSRQPDVLLGWRGGLIAWNADAGTEQPLEGPGPLDGGFQLVELANDFAPVGRPVPMRKVVITAEGTWHQQADGGWSLFSLPRRPDRFEMDAIVMDAGLGAYDPLKQIGARCETGDECGSGFCRDGRCCDQRCAFRCESCAKALGAVEDGVCSPADAGTECYREGCVVGYCDGRTNICGELVCRVDAGEPMDAGEMLDAGEPIEPEELADAGLRPVRDAGHQDPEPQLAPPGCGCTSAPGVTLLLALLALRRRARKG